MEPDYPARPWYRLHLVTWLAVALVGSGLVAKNLWGVFVSDTEIGIGHFARYQHGWPKGFLFRDPFVTSRWPFDNARVEGYDWVALAIDIAVVLVMLAATGFIVEKLRQRHTGPFQFGLRSILSTMFAVAIFLGLWKSGDVYWDDLLWLPIGLGSGCVMAAIGMGIRRTIQGRTFF